MIYVIVFVSSRRRHTRCALVTGVQTWLFLSRAPDARRRSDNTRCSSRGYFPVGRDGVRRLPAFDQFVERVAPDAARHRTELLVERGGETGRASCRERGGQYV